MLPHVSKQGVQAAKAVAATLRSFQPTIQELSQVSSELRSNLSTEMGLDELQKDFREIERSTRQSMSLTNPMSATPVAPKPPSTPSEGTNGTVGAGGMDEEERRALREVSKGLATMDEQQAMRAASNGTSQDAALLSDPDIERKRAESTAMAWGGVPQVLGGAQHAGEGGVEGRGVLKRLEDMTLAELQSELSKRQALIEQINSIDV
jgi:hypothetical protein